jgi:PBP1b-binding outer membrane lipoprotein LpoB
MKMKKLIVLIIVFLFLVGCGVEPTQEPEIILPLGKVVNVELVPADSYGHNDVMKIVTDINNVVVVVGFHSITIGSQIEKVTNCYNDLYISNIDGVRVVGSLDCWLLSN